MDDRDWSREFAPLIKKYEGKKHPLEYENRYQLLVMVILSARDSDKHINALAPALFKAYPTMTHLAAADADKLRSLLNSVVNFENKIKWLLTTAQAIQKDENIPDTLDELTHFSGIGRKSANVILRESGQKAEGIIVDLHVVRVAPRIGIATGDNPEKIEKQLMKILPADKWGEVGMAISFLGREICRPTNPKCPDCLMNNVCEYRKTQP